MMNAHPGHARVVVVARIAAFSLTMLGVMVTSGCARNAPAASPASPSPSPTPPPALTPQFEAPRTLELNPSLIIRPPVEHARPYLTWDVRQTAASSLGRIGAPAVPYLKQSLSSPHADVRQRSAEVLARIGPDAADATDALAGLLRDENPSVRKTAAWALGQIGPPAERAVPELMRILVTPAATPVEASP